MADLVKRVYSGFRGVDFRGEECNLLRSPDALNVWKDYKEIDSIRTRPTLTAFNSSLVPGTNSMCHAPYKGNKNALFVQNSKDLRCYYGDNFENVEYVGVLVDEPTVMFVYNDLLYVIQEGRYMYVPAHGYLVDVVGYVPTTSIGRKPIGGGTKHEDINLISDYRINTFVADGESTEYFLDAQDIDNWEPEIKINDVDVTNAPLDIKFTVDYSKGKITFKTAPSKPLTDGQDNVSIKFMKRVSGYKEKIFKCTLLQVFDNRVFLSGNPDYPNTIFHSSLNDPTYFSDLDYYTEGADSGKITGMVAGNNVLWVFKEPNTSNTTVFYHVPTIDSEYGKIYPSTHSSISTGCVGKAINFNDDIVFFSSRGMEGINGDITTEQAIAHRSSLVDRKLLAEEDYKNMYLIEWKGYLMVFVGHKVFLADSRAKFTNEDHYEYEWFYWDFSTTDKDGALTHKDVFVGAPVVIGEDLYCVVERQYLLSGKYWNILSTDFCKFEYGEEGIESYWTTPKDKFKFPQMQKTSNKRGCVCEAKGDVSVYAKTDKTDFELIGTYEDVEDYFVSRIKRKKFKDIQLKFHSHTRFSLESATLECFVGGYIKR